MKLLEVPEFTHKPLNCQVFIPTATVVICTRERPEALARCLAAVRRLDYPFITVVVVDNAPKGDCGRSIAILHGAEYRVAPVRGVSRVRNLGARACTTDVIAYLDDDMVPHRQWLRALAAEFSDPAVMAVSGPVLSMRSVDAGDAQLEADVRSMPWGPSRFHVDRGSPQWFERANFGGIGDGNMAFRREVFEHWPGFDEQIGRGMTIRGGEEHYAFFSIIDSGHRVAYTPAAMVFHPDKEEHGDIDLRAISDCSAYAAFVAARHPRFAWKVLRYFLEAALGRKRAWRSGHDAPMLTRVSRARAIGSFAAGCLLYWRARQESSRSRAQQPQAEAIVGG